MIPNSNGAVPFWKLGQASLLLVLLLLFVTSSTSTAQVARPSRTTCRNYQKLQNDLQQARAKWNNPACYNMKVERLGHFAFPQGPYNIQVRNDRVVDNGGGKLEWTINGYFDMIQSECLEGCPGSKTAAYWCWGSFDEATGAPQFFSIDRLDYLADADEDSYRITDIEVVECEEQQQPPRPPPRTETCRNYLQLQDDLDRARAKWTNPACYNMKAERLTNSEIPQGPYDIKVRHDRVVDNGGGKLEWTINGYFDMIQTECLEGCPGSETSAYKCRGTFDQETGVPQFLSIDRLDYLADRDEDSYRITDVETVECDKCLDYEQVAAELAEARNKWSLRGRDCYEMTVHTFRGRRRVGPYTIGIEHGRVTDDGGGTLRMTVEDHFDLIQKRCVDPCPFGSGAWYKCRITYDDDNGLPTSIYFHRDRRIADAGEHWYLISNWSGNDCERCDGYRTVSSNLEDARATWSDPLCYDFTVQELGNFARPIGPYNVKVRNGVMTDTGGGELTRTVNDYFDMIEETCVTNCPLGEDAAHKCTVSYHDNGAPNYMFVDMDRFMADANEYTFSISNVRVVDCDDGPRTPSRCSGYEKVDSELERAMDKWTNPPCYDLTVEELGFFPFPRGPYNLKVRHGFITGPIPNVPQLARTVNEWFDLIQERCVDDCLDSLDDAPYSCDVTYDDSGAPTNIVIVNNPFMTDGGEQVYRITNLNVQSPCEPWIWMPKLTQDNNGDPVSVNLRQANCMGYKELQTKFDAAQQAWDDLGAQCYTYTIQRVGRILEKYRGPFTVVVKNGVATVTEGSQEAQMNRTIGDWLSEFDETCLVGCPDNENAADKCIGEFDENMGYPVRMEFDYSLGVADEELVLVVTSLNVTSCTDGDDSAPTTVGDVPDQQTSSNSGEPETPDGASDGDSDGDAPKSSNGGEMEPLDGDDPKASNGGESEPPDGDDDSASVHVFKAYTPAMVLVIVGLSIVFML